MNPAQVRSVIALRLNLDIISLIHHWICFCCCYFKWISFVNEKFRGFMVFIVKICWFFMFFCRADRQKFTDNETVSTFVYLLLIYFIQMCWWVIFIHFLNWVENCFHLNLLKMMVSTFKIMVSTWCSESSWSLNISQISPSYIKDMYSYNLFFPLLFLSLSLSVTVSVYPHLSSHVQLLTKRIIFYQRWTNCWKFLWAIFCIFVVIILIIIHHLLSIRFHSFRFNGLNLIFMYLCFV